MKLLKKLVITVLLILGSLGIALYFLLQTHWGASAISNLIAENSRWRLTFDRMDHRWSSPSHLIFENVSIGRSGEPAALVAKKVDIGLSRRQIAEPRRVDSILLENGALNLAFAPLPLRADTLRLKGVSVTNPGQSIAVSARQVTGGIRPWQPDAEHILGRRAQFQFSAEELTLNGINARNALVQGSVSNGEINLQTIGADLARGTLTGRALRDVQGRWRVKNLRLNDIRLQSDKPLAEWLSPVSQLAELTLERMEIVDARLEGPGWALSDLSLSLRNLTLEKGRWSSQDGTLSLNAGEVIWGNQQFSNPVLDANLSAQGVTLRQFSSHWQKGMVRASGQWLRDTHTLALTDLALAGLEYTLPENWKAVWLAPLPGWLSEVTVQNLSASRNLLIDIDPTFPFQITSLDASGQRLRLAHNRQWGLWDGKLDLTAAAATFNRNDVRRPSLKLSAMPEHINISELSAFAGEGMLEATGSIGQQFQRPFTLNVSARNVPLDLLNNWGWPPLMLKGNGALRMNIKGSLQAGQPLRPTISGQLHAVDGQGNTAQQTMEAGILRGGEALTQPQQPNKEDSAAAQNQPAAQASSASGDEAREAPANATTGQPEQQAFDAGFI
ncbi:AsmA family protein [Enterobacteriaceae bacterium YMB-R22]|uniref:AsmA family protein n=1 Tax=Tenebrionicola larvae TaxID=2815733 RepID=UPI0020124ABD|nr:AsmA family protein [Tenebrionicola larvae]MBV4414341.1 AsmA family protein [Tenebrionicola larvae]